MVRLILFCICSLVLNCSCAFAEEPAIPKTHPAAVIASQEGAPFTVSLFATDDPVEGDQISVAVALSDPLPVTGATVVASLEDSPPRQLFDNGAGPDAISGDGIYTTMLRVPVGDTPVYLHVTAQASGQYKTASYPLEVLPKIVSFPSSKLREAIEKELDLQPGYPITSSDLRQLNKLELTDGIVHDLSGLEFAINLEIFSLYGPLVHDISVIEGLANLRIFEAPNSNIHDLSPLAALENLVHLDLSSNLIKDLTPLAGCTNLRFLDLSENRVESISGIETLTQLTDLNLDGNHISDLTPLANLNPWHLHLAENDLRDISPLAGLTNLYSLFLQENGIADISPLTGLRRLYFLNLRDNKITSIEPLRTMHSLREVDLSRNRITDVSPLATFTPDAAPDFSLLRLYSNFIKTIEPLAGLTQLRDTENPVLDESVYFLYGGPQALHLNSNLLDIAEGSEARAIIDDLNSIPGLTVLYNWQREARIRVSHDKFVFGGVPGSSQRATTYLYNPGSADLEWTIASDQPWLVPLVGSGTIPPFTHETITLKVGQLPAFSESLEAHLTLNSNAEEGGEIDIPVTVVRGPAIANIPDQALRGVMENVLGKQPGETIFLSELASLTQLDAGNQGIECIAGLECARNLTELNLEKNKIRILHPLRELFHMESLNLTSNRVNDLSSITGLSKLEYLFMAENQIQDLTPLSDLRQLKEISLYDNWSVTDIEPLANLSRLRHLQLGGGWFRMDNIADLSPISSLHQLVTLDLSKRDLYDLSLLKDLDGIKELHLHGNRIHDLSGLEDVKALEILNLGTNRLTDISPLADHNTLRELHLDGNFISDPSPLSGLLNLETLYLDGNRIGNITSLSSLTQLRALSLRSNELEDISPITSMTKLTSLFLSWMPISNLEPLSDLIFLKNLSISRAGISDLSALAKLTNLESLSLDSNQIEDLRSLRGLTNLHSLNLQDNRISNLAPLANLTQLQRLELGDNVIHELAPLRPLIHLTWLDLSSNQINDVAPLSCLTKLDRLSIHRNFLEINPGSADRAVINALGLHASVLYNPQSAFMHTMDDWADTVGIPGGVARGDSTKHSPLRIPNLLAYGMGLNPFSIRSEHLPTTRFSDTFPGLQPAPPVRANGETNTFALYYFRDVAATGVKLSLLTSETLDSRTVSEPVEETIL